MRTRLSHLWSRLRSTYWFVPAAMLVATGIAAAVLLRMDREWVNLQQMSWIYTGSAAGARSLLATVAGSVITVAGVVFSIAVAALVQASSQFGPRLLRNFISDRGNQVVLGTFVSTFFYCLLILRAVRGGAAATYVPNLSVTVGVGLAVASLAVLIYFIDHVSQTLQAPQVAAAVGQQLLRVLARPFPAAARGEEATGDGTGSPVPSGSAVVAAASNGYLQAVNEDGLLDLARRHGVILYLACRPGDFLVQGGPLLHLAGGAGGAGGDGRLSGALVQCFFLGRQRSQEQDLEYAVRQLVEIGVRALSPGINDPFTAMNCIDWLGAALCQAAACGLPGPRRYDAEGHLRMVVPVPSFAGLADAALNQLRQFGSHSVAVSLRLLETLAAAATHLRSDQQRQVLVRHADSTYWQCRAQTSDGGDLADLQQRYQRARRALGAPADLSPGALFPPSA